MKKHFSFRAGAEHNQYPTVDGSGSKKAGLEKFPSLFYLYIYVCIYICIYTHINWSRIFLISSALLVNPFSSSCNQLISWDPPSGCNRQQADLITFFGRPGIPVYKSSLCHEPASMVSLPNVCINICMCINIRIYHTVYEHHFVHLYYIVYIILHM